MTRFVNGSDGQTKEKYPSIQKYYDVRLEKDEPETVTRITWSVNDQTDIDGPSGVYYLRTSRPLLDEQTTWEYYNIIRNVEDSFRTLKLDLDVRPIYHQKDELTQAHIFFGLLSCWV